MNYLFIAPNRQSLENLLPLANEINHKANVKFLVEDSLYHQNTEELLNGFNLIRIPIKLVKPFYYQSRQSKLLVLFRVYLWVLSYKKKFDKVVFGSMGSIEHLLGNRFKSKGSQIFLIQDSLLFQSEKRKSQNIIKGWFQGGNRKSICDKIFVSGIATKDVLLLDDIDPRKIFVTGIPRFQPLFNFNRKLNNQNLYDVLFLTSAFKWHGYNELEKEQLEILDIVQTRCKELKLTLLVRKHPRMSSSVQLRYGKLDENKSVHDSLSQSKLIVSANAISTSLIEARVLNKDVIFIEGSKKSNFDIKHIHETIEFTDLDNLKHTLEAERKSGNNTDYFISMHTPDSTVKILKEIDAIKN